MFDARRLAALTDVERDALAVLALEDRGLARGAWQEHLRDAGMVDERGRALRADVFTPMLERLERAGAVQALRAQQYGLAPDWIAPVVDDAAARGRLSSLARAVSRGRARWLSPVAEFRQAIALADHAAIARAAPFFVSELHAYGGIPFEPAIVRALGFAPPRAWVERLPDQARDAYLAHACERAFGTIARLGDEVLDMAAASPSPAIRARVATLQALAGDVARATRTLDAHAPETPWEHGARGFVALVRGDWDGARGAFAAGADRPRGQRVTLPSYLAVFDLLALATGPADPAIVERAVKKARSSISEWPTARDALGALAAFRATGRALVFHGHGWPSWIDELTASLVERWTGSAPRAKALEPFAACADDAGYGWLSAQLRAVARGEEETPSLLALLRKRETWQIALDAIESAARERPAAKDAPALQGEIHWEVGSELEWGIVRVKPYLVRGRAGAKGKEMSARRLAKEDALLDAHDRRIVDALLVEERAYRRGLPIAKLTVLAGHPRVRDEGGNRVAVVEREPEVHVERTAKGARVTIDPASFDESGAAARWDAGALVVWKRTPLAARLADVLGPRGVTVPEDGMARLGGVIASLSTALPVQTAAEIAGEAIPGDARARVHLFRAGSGLRARVCVSPAGEGGRSFAPGAPPAEIVADDGAGGLRRVQRDLAAEADALARLEAACPILTSLPRDGDDRAARDLDTCLALLLELGEAGAPLAWPEGAPMRVPVARQAKDVRVRVRSGGTWLAVEGEVKVDESRVVSMKELLAAATRARGRFVPIGEGEYLALTEDLRAKLEALGRVQDMAGKGRISTALLPAIDPWLEGLDVAWSRELQDRREALAAAEASTPPVPRALADQLRDYQRDGFAFLARRTNSGMGACLADDMGLGKTVQAIALLLHRAARGPALVIAPTSVCRNWEDELARFAPTLRVLLLADGDRAHVVESAGARDVVVASYGLLVTEEERLAAKRFATAVFDEAHALKNPATRRWAAARALSAEAAIALTGTPIENRAGELHALLDVLLPDMLGSRAAFDRAFGASVAEGRREAAQALRQIVRPFVLRRTKAQVLSELPPKTEMTRVVPATPEHQAFYEAARRRALERLANAKHQGIEILAEITRLRRAAIDPRLVGGDQAPPGGKIEALAEVVGELRDEGRRALVFSQFLEVLDLAKARLEADGIECRRLDGTMSAAARAEEVAAFQAGHGDVFLLSLKAGGLGMNLTAADFVIHLDPWWNPAVEDQATDRAHRIGQTRPVTIVRLVTEGTIEEKVLALHGNKRRLAEDVVGAADGVGKLDVELLADLLRESHDAPARRRSSKSP